MCGIFGWSYGRKPRLLPGQRETFACALAVANATRGQESWGYYARSGNKSVTHRELGSIARVAGIGTLAGWGILMAHTRQSTTGKITRENCHPFAVGKLLVAHNGIVFNHDELNKTYKRSCAVDSLHLAKHLAEGRPFAEIEAYGALEWVDTRKPNCIRLVRLAGGSLHAAGVKARGRKVAVVWSSDEDHLSLALDAAHVDWFMYEELREGIIYEAVGGQLIVRSDLPPLTVSPPSYYKSKWDSPLDPEATWHRCTDGVWRARVFCKCPTPTRTVREGSEIVTVGDRRWLRGKDGGWTELEEMDRGLWVDSEGQIHDTMDTSPLDGDTEDEYPDEPDPVVEGKRLHAMTEAEWCDAQKKETP